MIPPVAKTRVHIRKADITIGKAGVLATQTATAEVNLDAGEIELPVILTELQDKTHLTRRSIARILSESQRLDHFMSNPQKFIEMATEIINRTKRMAFVDGIRYERIGDKYYYAQELFETEALSGYLKNVLPVTKCVHDMTHPGQNGPLRNS